jgi:multicomponent Na+:H+ antiporter subunit D
MSLAGLPPLSGFFAKLSLLAGGVEVQQFWLVAVALFVSLLTLYSMTKIWTLGFWKPGLSEEDVNAVSPLAAISVTDRPRWSAWYLPIILLVCVTLVIGFGAGKFFPIAVNAGQELFNPSGYINAVFRSAE